MNTRLTHPLLTIQFHPVSEYSCIIVECSLASLDIGLQYNMSSARQDKIISNNWCMPLEGSTQIAYSLSFPNDSSHLQQQFCAPDLTPRFQQSGCTSFNQALEGDQMSTSLIPDMTSRLGHSSYTLFNQALEPDQMSQSLFAPNSLLQSEQNHPHGPRSTTWFHERDTPPVNHYSSNHTTSLPHDKHRYTTTKEGKAQGSSTNTRRRRKREVK